MTEFIDMCDSCGDWTHVTSVRIRTEKGKERTIYLCKHCKEYLEEEKELVIADTWIFVYPK